MKNLNLEEIHAILLNMVKAFTKVCEQYKIPYYMLGGTMLGAVRHKGFIPWDDDMDFGIPREYYDQLLNLLESELPSYMKIHTIENSENIRHGFAKLADTRTHIKDNRIHLPIEKQIGVNIDIFPLDSCDRISFLCRKIRKLNKIIWVFNSNGNIYKDNIKKILQYVSPFSNKFLVSKYDKLVVSSSTTTNNYLTNTWGRWGVREIIPTEWYGDKMFEFEGIKLRGIENYDSYLTKLYGNYMKMPPKIMQIAHIEDCFIEQE